MLANLVSNHYYQSNTSITSAPYRWKVTDHRLSVLWYVLASIIPTLCFCRHRIRP